MFEERRAPKIIARDVHLIHDQAIAHAFVSAWRGGAFVISRLVEITTNGLRAANTHLGRHLRHD